MSFKVEFHLLSNVYELLSVRMGMQVTMIMMRMDLMTLILKGEERSILV